MSSLKDFILQTKTEAQILTDFRTMFPQFPTPTYADALLTRYLQYAYETVPNGIVLLGFTRAYDCLLYGFAHLLVTLDVQADGANSALDSRQAASSSADGLSISYAQFPQNGTMEEWEYFFGNTNYGRMLLLLLKNSGFGASWGCYGI